MSATPIWIKGETVDLVIPVALDGVLQDITEATDIIITLRDGLGEDAALLGQWSVTTGEVVIRSPQTGADLGYADAVIPSDALLEVAASTTESPYWRDVVIVFDGTPPVRRWIERPRRVHVQDAVYQPAP